VVNLNPWALGENYYISGLLVALVVSSTLVGNFDSIAVHLGIPHPCPTAGQEFHSVLESHVSFFLLLQSERLLGCGSGPRRNLMAPESLEMATRESIILP
jgi:hypothetical protein